MAYIDTWGLPVFQIGGGSTGISWDGEHYFGLTGLPPSPSPGVIMRRSGSIGGSSIGAWPIAAGPEEVVTTITGAATLDSCTTTGGTSVGVVSILSGAATLDDFATTGGTSSALSGGTITLTTVRNWGNVLRDNTLIENVCVLDLTGRTVVYEQTNRTTDAFGNLAITDNSIAPGIEYMVATWNTAGTVRGFAKVTAT